jgi:hypothetical protein
MFGFKRKSGVRSPSAALRRALESDGLPAGTDAAALGVVESRDRYAGRTVTYFRVFDPARATARSVDVRGYDDLEAHPDLVLRAGHIEQDGAVVIGWRAAAADAASPTRERADRGAHGDDERYVFTDKDR